MNHHQRSLCAGAAAIACALLIRTADSRGIPLPRQIPAIAVTAPPETAPSYSAYHPDYPAESACLQEIPGERLVLPRYDRLPQLRNTTHRQPRLQELLEQPLSWELRREYPTVLIYFTHATESYTPAGEEYEESGPWRTLDCGFNMVCVGRHVAALLEEAGIGVVLVDTLHDYPSYNGSYANSRVSLQTALAENSGIALVLDLHRDAADAPGGGQYRTLARLGTVEMAQLMPVLGGESDHYTENLALALKLCAQLERQVPGITRPIQLRNGGFNQDLSPGAVLIEVGAAGNTRAEALLGAEQLALAIIALASGTAR